MRIRLLLALLPWLGISALPASNALSQDALDPIEQTITGMITAFQADDAEGAFAYSAPSVKRMFRSPQAFIYMVRHDYFPVYRPQSYAFTVRTEVGNQTIQELEVVGPKGNPWRAIYTLRQQPDGSWKVTGCFLKHLDGRPA